MSSVLHPDDDLSEGATLARGRFAIEGLIGLGASGVVHAAIDRESGQKVALKVLAAQSVGMADRVARFEREARVGLKLASHPNLVAVRDAGHLEPPDGRPFLVLDYVRGPTLTQVATEPLDADTIVSLTRDLASGLAALHAQGVVHRDLKPSNVLVDQSRTPPLARITDFGLAIEAAGDDPADAITRIDARPGTPIYMAPEQFAGVRASFAADVYALGATLYELVSGQRPFATISPEGVAGAKLRGDPPGPHLSSLRSDLPPSLVSLIDACLLVDPTARPSIAAIVERLGGRAAGRKERRTRVLGAMAIAAAALAVGWFGLVARSDSGRLDRIPVAPDLELPDEATPPPDVEGSTSGPRELAPITAADTTGSPAGEFGHDSIEDREPKTGPDRPASTAKVAGKPDKPRVTRPPDGPAAEPEPDCAAIRSEAERAARATRWGDVLEATQTRTCWPDAVARTRLRIEAHAGLSRWPACIREGADVKDPQVEAIRALCRRKAME